MKRRINRNQRNDKNIVGNIRGTRGLCKFILGRLQFFIFYRNYIFGIRVLV